MCLMPMSIPCGQLTSCRNFTTLSKLSSGSPMPISTMFDIFSPESFSENMTSSSISPGSRLRTSPPMVEAQKAQPWRQPTCVEMHTVLPWWYCITTVSTALPSERPQRYFTVPSWAETCLRSTCGAAR